MRSGARPAPADARPARRERAARGCGKGLRATATSPPPRATRRRIEETRAHRRSSASSRSRMPHLPTSTSASERVPRPIASVPRRIARGRQQTERVRPRSAAGLSASCTASSGTRPSSRRKRDAAASSGRGERIRTFDLLNPIQVRYQAALRPDRGGQYTERPERHGTRESGAAPKDTDGVDDQQQLLVVIGAAVAGALIGILVVLILDLPAGRPVSARSQRSWWPPDRSGAANG